MSEDEKGYNGWKNYPTWNVALWLGNDAFLASQVEDLTRETLEEHEARTGYGTEARGSLAHHLRVFVDDLIEDTAPAVFEASFVADIFGWAMDQVDWFEIADNYLSDVSTS